MEIWDIASEIESKRLHKSSWCLLEGKTVTLAFFEPSTRTRLSFQLAAKRLCANVLPTVGEEALSLAKGESFHDTVMVLDELSDVLVIRHWMEGAAKYASEIAKHAIVNAGDGRNYHPTQTLIDLYTVKKRFGTIDGLSFALVGDLRYARTAKSLLMALTKFNVKSIYIVAPPQLKPHPWIVEELRRNNVRVFETDNLNEIIGMVDVLYVTRIQKERIPDPAEYEKLRGSYRVTLELVKRGKSDLLVLHPLPRLDELDYEIDSTPHAGYLEQVRVAVPVRMAALAWSYGVV